MVTRFPHAQPACVHHWLLEKANGPTSIGTCKFCGARGEFSNYVDDYVLAPQGAALQSGVWPKRRPQRYVDDTLLSLEELREAELG